MNKTNLVGLYHWNWDCGNNGCHLRKLRPGNMSTGTRWSSIYPARSEVPGSTDARDVKFLTSYVQTDVSFPIGAGFSYQLKTIEDTGWGKLAIVGFDPGTGRSKIRQGNFVTDVFYPTLQSLLILTDSSEIIGNLHWLLKRLFEKSG